MKLSSPVKDFKPILFPNGDVTQFFGEHKELYASTCVFGSTTNCLTGGHNGWDIVRPWGTPIYAVSSGRIVELKEDSGGYGKHIRILDTDNREWVYGHLSSISVAFGQFVVAGDEIGKMGNTGYVVSGPSPFWQYNPYAGTHLHLGYRNFTPWNGTGTYTIQYGTGERGTITDYTNGFLGSQNFSPTDFTPGEVSITQMQLTVISLANTAIALLKKLLNQ